MVSFFHYLPPFQVGVELVSSEWFFLVDRPEELILSPFLFNVF